MADLRPIGVDQTTGQQRQVMSDDSVVNNIGAEIEVLVKQVGDYSGGANQVQVLYPWDTPTLLGDPASSPGASGQGVRWSPNGEFLSVAHDNLPPSLSIYQRTGTNLVQLDTPASVPGNINNAAAWSPSGEYMSIGSAASPFIFNYQRDGSQFTLLPSPASAPTAQVTSVDWSPNGEFLATAHQGSPFLSVYQREGSTLNRIANPATLPGASGLAYSCRWSPNGRFLAVGGDSSPYLTIYQRNGLTSLEKLADPASLPSLAVLGTSWSADSQFLAVTSASPGGLFLYQRSGTTFTKLADPASLPSGIPFKCDFSPNGGFLAVVTNAGVGLFVYQRNDTVLSLLDSPASAPGSSVSVDWTPDQQFLTIGNTGSSGIANYQTGSSMPAEGVVVTIHQTLADWCSRYCSGTKINSKPQVWINLQGTSPQTLR